MPLGDLKEMVQAVEQYEKHIPSASEVGKLKSTVPSEASLRRYREYPRATISKSNRVNTRLSTPDPSEIQARAIEPDIPYGIFIASILHKFLASRFLEMPSRLMTRDSGRGKKRRAALCSGMPLWL